MLLTRVSRKPIDPTLSSDVMVDLGFDSLQVLEFVSEVEDHFDISISLNDVPVIRTVGQVVDCVRTLVAARGAA